MNIFRIIELTVTYSDSEWYEGKIKGRTAAATVHGSGWCKPYLSLLYLRVMMFLVGASHDRTEGTVTDKDQ